MAEPADGLTVYTQNNFTDLCRGPHVQSTGDINPKAVSISLRPPAGAYWRGDEERSATHAHLRHRLGNAGGIARLSQPGWKKRSNAIIASLGEKLDLFIIDSMVGKGLPLWLPAGAILRDTLERWLRDIQIERGYLPVVTPHLGNIELLQDIGSLSLLCR